MIKQPVIAIIGAGAVGSTVAFALAMQNILVKIILVDTNQKKCDGEIEDLIDTLSMSETSAICRGTLQDAACADIIIITAGVAQRVGEKRLKLLQENYAILRAIIQQMQPINTSAVIIIVTNPVDIMTQYVQTTYVHTIVGISRQQIFGSGTFLDTHRLRGFIGEHVQINPSSIHAYVLGEHGDNQFVAWSMATIGGVPIASFPLLDAQVRDGMAVKTQRKVYEIIACKGFTSFGIATSVVTYCKNILGNLRRIVPVSCFVERYGVCLSMPAVLGAQGVQEILYPPLSIDEQQKLEMSVEILKKQYAEITQIEG